MQYKLDTVKPSLICLILLISFPSVSTVLISPALPAMSHYFAVSGSYIQQTITLFVVGYALGQLLYSPFANRFGRKTAIKLGISLYLLSSIICLLGIYWHSIDIVLIGRLLMALGASVGMIISFTIINDFYYAKQARTIVSYTVLAYAFMPALGVLLGGFLTTNLSWKACFYFYILYGILIYIISLRLPETLKHKNFHALKLKPLTNSYLSAFQSRQLVLFSIIYGLMSAFIYITASSGPFIGIKEIGLSSEQYGLIFLIPYCGQIIGALTAGRISQHFSGYQVMALGYTCTIFGSLFIFISFFFGWINLVTFIVPIFFVMIGLPMTYSTVTVMALVNFEDKATGSAIMSFITMFITLIALVVLTLLPANNPRIMPTLFVTICVIAVIAFVHARRNYRES